MKSLLCTLVVTLVITGALSISYAATWYIKPDGTGDAPTIQAGIDSAGVADIVLLSNGTYTGDGNRDLDLAGKAIAVMSQGDDPVLCIIDCEGSSADHHRGFYFHSGEDTNSVVRGVTIKNGVVDYQALDGGGIRCEGASCPMLVNCVFDNNWSTHGGGLYCVNASSPVVRHCVFSSNRGGGAGCEILSSPTFTSCEFIENYSGGMECSDSSPQLDNCLFIGNENWDGGGGMRCVSGSSPVLNNCEFVENEAPMCGSINCGGGGMFCSQSSPTLTDCTFFGNRASGYEDDGYGGGLHCYQSAPTLINCTFSNNVAQAEGPTSPWVQGNGGAISCYYSSPTLVNCTLYENYKMNNTSEGGGLWCGSSSSPILENTIIAFNYGEALYCDDVQCHPVLTCCDLYGNSGGNWIGCIASQLGVNGNISSDPQFCGRATRDFRLISGSPCLNPSGCGTHIGALGLAEPGDGGECDPLLGDDGQGGVGGVDQQFTFPPKSNPGGCKPPFSGQCECDPPWFSRCNLQHSCKCVLVVCPPYLDHFVYTLDPATVANGVSFQGVVIPTGFEGIDIYTNAGDALINKPVGTLLEFSPGVTKFAVMDIPLVIDLEDFQGDEVPMGLWFNTMEFGAVFRVEAQPDSVSTGVESTESNQLDLHLSAPCPNPAVRTLSFFVNYSKGGSVDVRVYDVAGRMVRSVRTGLLSPGRHEFEWNLENEDGTQVASGVYFVVAEAAGMRKTRKIVIVR